MTDISLNDALEPGETWQQSVERRLRELDTKTPTLGDLPLAALQRKLENDWQPEGSVLLQPKSVTPGQLQIPCSFGVVNGTTGAVLVAGSSDWTSARTGVGLYTVTFTPAFAASPAVTLAADTTGTSAHVQHVGTPTTAGFSTAMIVTTTGALIDRNFSFIAIGAK